MNPESVTGSSEKGPERSSANRMEERRRQLNAATRRPLLPSGPIPTPMASSYHGGTLPSSGIEKARGKKLGGLRKTKSGGVLKSRRSQGGTKSASNLRQEFILEEDPTGLVSSRGSSNTVNQLTCEQRAASGGSKPYSSAPSVAAPASETVRNISFLPRNGEQLQALWRSPRP